jgi:transposase
MSLHRYELSDFEWAIIEPLLPNKPRDLLVQIIPSEA